MKRFIFYAINFLFIVSSVLYSQKNKIRFDKLTIEDGLSQSSINAILQDKYGFLWIGTNDGLNRYDGNRFRIFRYNPDDTTSLSQNFIRTIFQDSQNTLWIATENGLCRYNHEKENFTRYFNEPDNPNSISNNHIRKIIEDNEGFLWLATTYGLNKFDYKNNKTIRYHHFADSVSSLADNFIRTVFHDSRNNIWVATEVGLDLFDRQKNIFSHIVFETQNQKKVRDVIVLCFEEDRKGNLWIGTRNDGLFKYDRKKNIFIEYIFDYRNPFSLSANAVHSILEDSQGNIWAGTHGGLEKYDPDINGFIHYQHSVWEPSSISSNVISRVYEDISGIIWVGSNFGGLNKFDRRKNQFVTYRNDPQNSKSLQNNNVTVFFENSSVNDATIWLGTFGGGFGSFNRTTEEFQFYPYDENNPNSISNNYVRSVLGDSQGQIWIGTENGVNKFDPKSKKFERVFYQPGGQGGIAQFMIKYLYEDSDGLICIGTNGGGLMLYDKKNKQFKTYLKGTSGENSINDNIVWCIHEMDDGILWIGTNSGGINVFDKRHNTFSYLMNKRDDPFSLSYDKVLCFYESLDGTLWIGTAGGGLNKYDKVEKKFIRYSTDDGLATNTVHAMVEDNENHLWITTNNGLSRFDYLTGQFTNFKDIDGLQSSEFNVNAVLKSKTGEIFLGGIGGFNVFKPEDIKLNEKIPQLVITDFKLFNKSIPIGRCEDDRILLEQSITNTSEITLQYYDQVISFEFSALDYTAPEKNQYAYIMEGFEKEWNYVGNINYATYTKLPPGSYTFRVKGSNNSGVWNDEGTYIRIFITPPYWETIWFRLLVLIILTLLLFIIYKSRVRFIEQRRKTVEEYNKQLSQEINERKQTEKELIKAKELAEKANELKSDFLAQISHEIRSPINIVLSYLGLIKEELKEHLNSTIADSLLAIDTANGRIIRTIDLILNMSEIQLGIYEPSMTPINLVTEVIDRLIIEYSKKAGGKGLKLSLNSEIENPYIMGDRYSVTQIFANLIDNAIKYSEKGEINILIKKVDDSKLSVHIKDTGIGISEEYLPHLFDEFSQEEHGYSRSFEGNGLGLALVKKYCNINNVEISVLSKKGIGTEFILIFLKSINKSGKYSS